MKARIELSSRNSNRIPEIPFVRIFALFEDLIKSCEGMVMRYWLFKGNFTLNLKFLRLWREVN